MLTVSLGAMSYLAQLLEEAGAPRPVAIRFVLQKRQKRLCLRMDHPQPDDVVWNHGQRTVLVIQAGLAQRIAGEHLLVEGRPGAERLIFAANQATAVA